MGDFSRQGMRDVSDRGGKRRGALLILVIGILMPVTGSVNAKASKCTTLYAPTFPSQNECVVLTAFRQSPAKSQSG